MICRDVLLSLTSQSKPWGILGGCNHLQSVVISLRLGWKLQRISPNSLSDLGKNIPTSQKCSLRHFWHLKKKIYLSLLPCPPLEESRKIIPVCGEKLSQRRNSSVQKSWDAPWQYLKITLGAVRLNKPWNKAPALHMSFHILLVLKYKEKLSQMSIFKLP